MKNDKLVPGLIIMLIGVAFLLDNFGYINFDWEELWHLWPLFLIIGGINLVFAHNTSPLATVLKISAVVIGFVFVLFAFSTRGDHFGNSSYHSWFHRHYDNDNNNDKDDDDDDDDDDSSSTKGIVKIEGSSNFNAPYTSSAKIAQLNISGGGTKYILSDTTNQLFKADTKEHFGKYTLAQHNDGSTYVLDFDMKDKKDNNFNIDIGDKSNAVIFKLNPNPLWDINVDAGVIDLKFDLTKFKIRTLKLDGGAASFDVKLGQPTDGDSNVEVSTGMASVHINIPQTAACKIITDSGLSSHSFDGFTKKNDGDYETPGFESAKNKIIINISGGISAFNVNRY